MEYKENQIRTDVRKKRQKGQTMRTPKASASTHASKRAPATKKAEVKADPTEKQLAVTQVIKSWTPKKNSPVAKSWDDIAPVVRKYISALEIGNPELARKYIRPLARHVASRYELGHAIASAEEIFNDDALATTFGESVVSTQSLVTQQMDLLFMKRMRAKLLPERYGLPKELRYARAAIPKPYNEKEITQMLTFVRERSSKNCVTKHGALLLCLGAGLSGKELKEARGSDLIATPWGLFIDTKGLTETGNRCARQVPILAEYEDELSALAEEIGDHLFLGLNFFGQMRDASDLSARADRGPHFEAYRARSTWLRKTIGNGASLLSLRQAGVPLATEKHLWVCSAGLEQSFEDYVVSMRGSGKGFDQSKHEHLMQYAMGQ
jgi:hypothetical protein